MAAPPPPPITHRVLGVGAYGCVIRSRLPCEDESEVPANQRDTRVGKLFFERGDANNEWKLAEDIRDHVDPANEFTPGVHRLCKVISVPRDVHSGCQHSRHILDREPYQLIMDDAGVAWSKVGALSVATWLDMLQTALTGLVALYDNGAAHLDLKPDNLLYQAATRRAFLIDFSLVAPTDHVFDADFLRENGDYEVWPPEFAMLHDIRQQQYQKLYVHGQGPHVPATYADKLSTIQGDDAAAMRQVFLDELDAESMERLDVDRVVRAGVRRFITGFPTTGSWGSRMATDALTEDVNRWREAQRENDESAKTTVLRYAAKFDTYGVAYTIDCLLGEGRFVFDAFTTDDQFRAAIFRFAREPSAVLRATVSELLQAIINLKASRQQAEAAAAAAAAARMAAAAAGGGGLGRARAARARPSVAADLAARAAARAIAAQQENERRLAEEAAAAAEAARLAQAELARQIAAAALAARPIAPVAALAPALALAPRARRRLSAARRRAAGAVPGNLIDLTGPSPPPHPLRGPVPPPVINLWSP